MLKQVERVIKEKKRDEAEAVARQKEAKKQAEEAKDRAG